MIECQCPLYTVAHLFVPAGNLTESKVGINGRSPLFLLGVAIHVHQSYAHNIILSPKSISTICPQCAQ